MLKIYTPDNVTISWKYKQTGENAIKRLSKQTVENPSRLARSLKYYIDKLKVETEELSFGFWHEGAM